MLTEAFLPMSYLDVNGGVFADEQRNRSRLYVRKENIVKTTLTVDHLNDT
jgi:hypothetical protein